MRNISRLTLTLCAAFLFTTLARADAEADAKTLVDKAIKAGGGEDKLTKAKAMTMKSKGKFYGVSPDGIDYTAETSWQFPDRVRDEIHADINGQKFVMIEILDGDKGWNSQDGKTDEMKKDALTEAKESMHSNKVGMLYPLKGKEFKLTTLGDAKVDGKETAGVKVTSEGHRDINLYFDKKTGLLLKSESKVKDLMTDKEVNQEILYGDYKDVDGIQHPHKITIKRDGKDYVVAEVTDIKVVEKLDNKLFEKP